MTEQLMKAVVDCVTNEVSYIPLSDDELASLEAIRLEAEAQKAAAEAEAQAKAEAKASAQAKLAALGLTAEEISAL